MADELAALRSPSPQLPLGIVWRSPIWDPSGYADDSRLFLKALAHGPRDLAAREIRWSDATCALPHADVALLKTLTRCQRPPYVAAITSCIPSGVPTLCPPDRSASLNILRATFETDRIPADWMPIIEQFDEVWLFSTHDQLIFRRSGVPPEKMRVLPGFVDTDVFWVESPELGTDSQTQGLALPEALKGRFVFLSVFDWQLRKGWDVLLNAYCEEFSPEEGIGLLLKITTSHGHSLETVRRQADEVLATLGQSLDQRPDIVIWEPTLGKLERYGSRGRTRLACIRWFVPVPRAGRHTDWSSHLRARAANSSTCRGQSCNVAGSKSAPLGQTSVCTSGSMAT